MRTRAGITNEYKQWKRYQIQFKLFLICQASVVLWPQRLRAPITLELIKHLLFKVRLNKSWMELWIIFSKLFLNGFPQSYKNILNYCFRARLASKSIVSQVQSNFEFDNKTAPFHVQQQLKAQLNVLFVVLQASIKNAVKPGKCKEIIEIGCECFRL